MLKFIGNLKNGKPQKIVAYGTSLTAKGAWCTLLSNELEKRFPGLTDVVNSGESAMNSQWAVENLSEKVLAQKPDVLFIEFAVNDAFGEYGISISAARINLKYIIERVATDCPDCELILMTMNPPTEIHLEKRPAYEMYYKLYRDIAEERSLTLIDNCKIWKELFEKDKKLFKELIPDGLHPAPEGDKCITLKNIIDVCLN